MKRLFLSFFSVLIVSLANAQWYWQNPKPQGSIVTDIKMISVETGYFTGANGVIFKTTEGGKNFYQQLPGIPTEHHINGFAAVNDQLAFAVGGTALIHKWPDQNTPRDSTGFILRTKNGGERWEKIHTDTMSFNAICITDSIHGIVIGRNGTILKTDDCGDTWHSVISSTNSDLLGICFPSKDTGYISTFSGMILKTVNGGSSWITINPNSPGPCSSVFFLTPDYGFVSAISNEPFGGGEVLRTYNGGQTWQFSPIARIPLDIMFVDSLTGYAACGYIDGSVFKTTDGGLTWNSLFMVSTSCLYTVDFNQTEGFAAGAGGNIYKTVDSGLTWDNITEGNRNILLDVHFFDEQNGIAVGKEVIQRTSDGGQTWIPEYVPDVFYTCMAFSSKNDGFMGSANWWGPIYKTTDRGNTWTHLFDAGTSVYTMQFPSSSVGYIGGEDGRIFKTINGGASWDTLYTLATSGLETMFFLNEEIGYTTAYYHAIQKTTDGGQSWTLIPYNPDLSVSSLWFITKDTGFFAGSYIGKTTDGGINWVKVNQPDNEFYICNTFLNKDTGYVCGKHGAVLRTSDGGDSWTRLPTPMGGNIEKIFFIDDYNAWIVGTGGTILATQTYGDYLGINDKVFKAEPLSFKIYPNPSDGEFTLQYVLKNPSDVNIKITDLLGRERFNSFLTKQDPGIQNVKVTINCKEDGIYLVRIVAGKEIGYRKLIVLKS